MKTRKSDTEEVATQESGCCTTTVNTKENDPCCEQPTDGSSCCDKTESKEVNAEKTGCC
jgi:hypothetical protein